MSRAVTQTEYTEVIDGRVTRREFHVYHSGIVDLVHPVTIDDLNWSRHVDDLNCSRHVTHDVMTSEDAGLQRLCHNTLSILFI